MNIKINKNFEKLYICNYLRIQQHFCPLKIIQLRYLIIFNFILLSSFNLIAQKQGYRIEGNIQDSISGEPIKNVSITVPGTRFGTSSNAMGNFSLFCENLPAKIEFSHVSYKPTSVQYNVQSFQKLSIKMERSIQPLIGVTVHAQKIDTVYQSETYSVLDYELLDRGILLLIYKDRLSRSELLLIDYSGKTINGLPVLPDKPLMLYQDCLDSVHIITRNQSFQIYWNGLKPQLYPPYPLDFFKQNMDGCKFQMHNKVFFESFAFYNLKKQFYYVDTAQKEKVLLTTIKDSEKLDFIYDNPENFSYLSGQNSAGLGSLKGLPGDSSVLSQIRNMNVEARFNKMAYLSDINAPIFKLGDSVYIFNHPENQIEVYNLNDSLVHVTPISYHLTPKYNQLTTFIKAFVKNSRWMEEIYTDKKTNQAYTLFKNMNGTFTLKQINLSNGELSDILTIPFPYVQKIKIRNDEIFFIYRGWGDTMKKKLFRQMIAG